MIIRIDFDEGSSSYANREIENDIIELLNTYNYAKVNSETIFIGSILTFDKIKTSRGDDI